MSAVDYHQTAEDHQSFLVLVRHTGAQLSWKHFSRCLERITALDCVAVPGQKRDMMIRYKRSHSRESNEWGDFQLHRKALGLISIGRCSNEEEFKGLFDCYKKEKEHYSDTLYNSRLVVFGMNTDGTHLSEEQVCDLIDSSPAPRFKIDEDSASDTSSLDCDASENLNDETSARGKNNGHAVPVTELTDPLRRIDSSPKKTVSSEPSPSEKIDSKSDKLEKSPGSQISFIRRKSEKPEKAVNKKKEEIKNTENIKRTGSNGSIRDMPGGAEVVFFPGIDNCEGLEECVREFVTSLFFVLEGKRLDRAFERGDRSQLLCAPFEKKDFVGVDVDTKSFKKKCQGRLRKHLADLCLLAGLPGEAMLHYSTAVDILKPVNDYLWMGACYEGLCATSVIAQYGKPSPQLSTSLRRNQSFSLKRGVAGHDKMKSASLVHSYANGLQDLPETMTKSNLNPDDIVDKYKDALMYYSKYKNAAIIEMEASFKACRILIQQKKRLQASDFLQNVVYINLQLSDEDRINRYGTLANLYSEIGFNRKASFFRRVAAMQCVAPQNPKHNWPVCHQLLVQALEGFKIYLDPSDSTGKPGEMNGWPVLQSRVLHELIYSAKRMGNLPLAIRYLTLFLHSQLCYLGDQEKREVVSSLESFTSQCEGSHSQPLALESGVIVPGIPLINVPLVKTFKLSRLTSHLEPKKILVTATAASDNVFIFTPLNLSSTNDDVAKPEVDFCWVEGDLCEVQLHVTNPMPDDLPLSHVGLLTEGLEIETFPTSARIPAEHAAYLVKIMLRPKMAGDLTVLGYTTRLYGVHSSCKLRDCVLVAQSHLKVKVTPALPQVQLSSSLPKSADFLSFGEEFNIVTSGTAVLYTGQSTECTVTLQNTGKLPVEWVEVSLESTRDTKEYVCEVFRWNADNIHSQLPLPVNNMLCFNLAVRAVGDFLVHSDRELTRKNAKTVDRSVSLEGRTVEGILKVDYSGGAGYQGNYCRCSSIAFSIEVLPSVVFHKWDVMLSESSDHCYLMYDVQNVCGQELEVHFSSQCLYLKHEQIKRVCIEIERCEPLLMEGGDNSDQQFSKMLATFVDIRWTIPSQNVHGRVETESLRWTDEQKQLVYKSPVSWEVRLNGQVISPLHIGSLEYKIGQLVRVDVEVVVKSDMAGIQGREAVLTMCCCQHHDNGDVNYSTQPYVTSIGTESVFIPQVSAEVPISHSCVYIFTCCGFYKFEISMKVKGQCQSIDNQGQKGGQSSKEVHPLTGVHSKIQDLVHTEGGTGRDLDFKAMSKGHYHSNKGQGDVKRDGQSVKKVDVTQGQVLKCSSVIEINIIE